MVEFTLQRACHCLACFKALAYSYTEKQSYILQMFRLHLPQRPPVDFHLKSTQMNSNSKMSVILMFLKSLPTIQIIRIVVHSISTGQVINIDWIPSLSCLLN